MSDSLRPHGLQHARPPCLSTAPRVYSNSCPLSRWCHPAISSSVMSFSSRLQSFPASESFPMSRLFKSGGQSIGVSASTPVLPMNTQDWSLYDGLVGSPYSPRTAKVSPRTLKSLLQHHSSKASILHSAFFIVQLSHPYMTTGKTLVLTRWTSVGKVMSLLFNMLSRLVTTFLPRNKHLLISWLQSPSAVILEPQKVKSATVSRGSPSICHKVMGPDTMIWVFWMLSFKPTFSQRFLKETKKRAIIWPRISLLGIYLGKAVIQKDTCTLVFIAALFTIAGTWKQPQWPLTEEWIKKM